MSDAMPPDGEREPTDEEMRAYLGQLRQAPLAEVIAQAISMLANASQVKMGRRDARLLIDATAQLADGVRDHLGTELATEADQVIQQLRLGQVEAEKELAQLRVSGEAPETEPNDLPATGGAAPAQQQQPQQPPASEQPSGASRLWTPGT